MRIFVTKEFARFARREGIGDKALGDAIARAERGLVDADLGGGLIKQRVPRKGQGRAAGFRVLIAYRREQIAVYLHGFAKSSQGNLDDDELEALKGAAEVIFGLSAVMIEKALTAGKWKELDFDE